MSQGTLFSVVQFLQTWGEQAELPPEPATEELDPTELF